MINKKGWLVLYVFFVMCPAFSQTKLDEQWRIGNPASTNCAANHNGSLYMATDSKTGGQYGICLVSPTLAVEEWCLLRADSNLQKVDCPNLIVLIKDGQK